MIVYEIASVDSMLGAHFVQRAVGTCTAELLRMCALHQLHVVGLL